MRGRNRAGAGARSRTRGRTRSGSRRGTRCRFRCPRRPLHAGGRRTAVDGGRAGTNGRTGSGARGGAPRGAVGGHGGRAGPDGGTEARARPDTGTRCGAGTGTGGGARDPTGIGARTATGRRPVEGAGGRSGGRVGGQASAHLNRRHRAGTLGAHGAPTLVRCWCWCWCWRWRRGAFRCAGPSLPRVRPGCGGAAARGACAGAPGRLTGGGGRRRARRHGTLHAPPGVPYVGTGGVGRRTLRRPRHGSERRTVGHRGRVRGRGDGCACLHGGRGSVRRRRTGSRTGVTRARYRPPRSNRLAAGRGAMVRGGRSLECDGGGRRRAWFSRSGGAARSRSRAGSGFLAGRRACAVGLGTPSGRPGGAGPR